MIKTKTLLLAFTLIIPFMYGCKDVKDESKSNINVNENIPVYDFESFEHLLYTNDDKTVIVNFWAMWCVPCVKEMPIIEEYRKNNPEVEIILVSMDFPEDIETKLKPFLKEREINSRVVLLDDPNSNEWIDKVNPNWSGAIPYTIIFNKDKRSYHERDFENLKDLENEVNKTINN